MSKQKIKKNGQAALGGVLIIILLVAFVFFIFFLIRRPTTPPGPIPMAAGVSPESIEELQKEMTEIEKRCPITKVLPYGGPFYEEPFFIDPPTKEGIIWISIDKDTNQEEIRRAALNWIKQKGYNPEDYDIKFELIDFPK